MCIHIYATRHAPDGLFEFLLKNNFMQLEFNCIWALYLTGEELQRRARHLNLTRDQ